MIKPDIWKTLRPALRNIYVVTALGFIIWMFFFDDNNLIERFTLQSKVNKLEAEKQQLIESIEQDRRKMDELKGSRSNLEKFAREEYYMKRDNEVIFIVK